MKQVNGREKENERSTSGDGVVVRPWDSKDARKRFVSKRPRESSREMRRKRAKE
jgi:hypothetical protein